MFATARDFCAAASAFARKSRDANNLADVGLSGWEWNEHPTYPGLGYLTRRVFLSVRAGSHISSEERHDSGEEEEEEEDDPAAAPVHHHAPKTLTCVQTVAFSPTFRVPVFYFTVHDAHGSPLPLAQIVETSLLRLDWLPAAEMTAFALSPPDSSFPLISQGDLPSTGAPSWYLHPCGMPSALDELAREADAEAVDGQVDRGLRTLELWFMVVSSVVDLRG